jgi:hypothetical protein
MPTILAYIWVVASRREGVGCAIAVMGTSYSRAPIIDTLFVSFTHHQPFLSSPPSIMSAGTSTSTPNSNFTSIFNAALESYRRKTKKELASHPLLPEFQSCDSSEAILNVLREQIPAFNQSQNGDERLTKWVSPTVNVLYTFSATIGQGIGLVRIGILCRRIFTLTYTFRHSHRQMQSLQGLAFSSWSVSSGFMCRLRKPF